MKILRKILKTLLIGLFIFISLLYGTVFIGHKLLFPIKVSKQPTLPAIETAQFCFGVQCQPSTFTVEKYLPIFASQLKIYNEKSDRFWPDNQVQELYALVQSIEKNQAWLISPQGEIEIISKKQVKELSSIRPRYDTGFQYFETDKMQGVYLALSEVGLRNVLAYEKYRHLGTYDLFLTYTHEMFHMLEQDKVWTAPKEISNRARNDFLDQPDMLAERNLIFRQVLNAVAETDSIRRDSLVLQVVSNYKAFKENYAEAEKNAHYFDRTEGTAFYFELISSLYSAYPKQVNSEETLEQALQLLAKNSNPTSDVGLVSSSYPLGGWTCVLLDFLQEDKTAWKKQIMENGELAPLEILSQQYENAELPEAERVAQLVKYDVKSAIEKAQNFKVAPNIFRFLYQSLF